MRGVSFLSLCHFLCFLIRICHLDVCFTFMEVILHHDHDCIFPWWGCVYCFFYQLKFEKSSTRTLAQVLSDRLGSFSGHLYIEELNGYTASSMHPWIPSRSYGLLLNKISRLLQNLYKSRPNWKVWLKQKRIPWPKISQGDGKFSSFGILVVVTKKLYHSVHASESSSFFLLFYLKQLFCQLHKCLFLASKCQPKNLLCLCTAALKGIFSQVIFTGSSLRCALCQFWNVLPQQIGNLLRWDPPFTNDEPLSCGFRESCCFNMGKCDILCLSSILHEY